jgi:glucan-binding YG repeat protein
MKKNSKTNQKKSKTKSWAEKYNTRTEVEVKHLDKGFADIPENSEMLIATPQVFEDYIKKIKKGKSKTLKEIRQDLAKKYSADYTCPLTTGIFVRIVAEANFEKIANGEDIEKVAPFWRAIEPRSSLAKKLSFGEDFIVKMRKEEGLE